MHGGPHIQARQGVVQGVGVGLGPAACRDQGVRSRWGWETSVCMAEHAVSETRTDS